MPESTLSNEDLRLYPGVADVHELPVDEAVADGLFIGLTRLSNVALTGLWWNFNARSEPGRIVIEGSSNFELHIVPLKQIDDTAGHQKIGFNYITRRAKGLTSYRTVAEAVLDRTDNKLNVTMRSEKYWRFMGLLRELSAARPEADFPLGILETVERVNIGPPQAEDYLLFEDYSRESISSAL